MIIIDNNDKIITIMNLTVKEIDIKMIKTNMNGKKYNKNTKNNKTSLIN